MNVYVETNFILELVLLQEQSSSCESILQLCKSGQLHLIVPAYSLVEQYEKLARQANSRRELQRTLDVELRQLARTTPYNTRIESIEEVNLLLIRSNEEEHQRFIHYRNEFLENSEIIDLTSEILGDASVYEDPLDLRPQDAIVYASVLNHLRQSAPQAACFLNRNLKDFDNPDIVNTLNEYNCRLIPRFDHGLSYIQSQM